MKIRKKRNVPPDNLNFVDLAGLLCGEDKEENESAYKKYCVDYDVRHKLSAELKNWKLHKRRDGTVYSDGLIYNHPVPSVKDGEYVQTVSISDIFFLEKERGILLFWDHEEAPNYICYYLDMNLDMAETLEILEELKNRKEDK